MANYILGENAARKLRALFAGKDSASGAGVRPFGVSDGDDYPAPWTFQWSDAEDAWIVWLPGGSVQAAHDYQGALVEDGQIAAATEYGTGWYTTSLAATSGAWTPVYLDCQFVKTSQSDPGTAHAFLTTSPSSPLPHVVERVTVVVAEIYEDADGVKNARGIADGAVIALAGPGGGGAGASEDVVVAMPIEYDEYSHKLTYVPRTLTFAGGLYMGHADGDEVEVFEAVPHVAHD